MLKVGLFVRLIAKEGKEEDLQKFLEGGLPLAQGEPGTVVWYAVRFDDSTFGIFDAFEGEEGRDAHLSGPIAAALMQRASELLAQPPSIEKVEVLAAK